MKGPTVPPNEPTAGIDLAVEDREEPAGTPPNPKAIARSRRKLARRRVWKLYRQNKMGMAGLIILVFFLIVAVFAPLITNGCSLNPTCPLTGAPLKPPSLAYPFWFGTDNFGRPVLALNVWGARISLLVGLISTFITMIIGSGMRLVAGFYGGW